MSNCWSEEQHHEMVKYASENLWRYIQHNGSLRDKEKTFLNLTGMTLSNLKKLSEIYFLLSEDVRVFVDNTAPAILNRLSKNSRRENVTLRGKVKGQVLWSKTYTARLASGGDPSLYVCQQRSSLFDLPENRVFLFVLKQIHKLSSAILSPKILENLSWSIKQEGKWTSVIHHIGIQSAKLLKNPFVREISDIPDLQEILIQQAEKARGVSYIQLVKTARCLNKSTKHRIDFLYEKLSFQMLMPLNQDALYEISVLYKILEHAKGKGWSETTINLIGGGSEVISRLKKKDVTLNVYYQSLPKYFYNNSKYKILINHYNIDAGYRRPDIVLEWVRKDKIKRYCIVEVKRSENRTYLIDGLYKLLGYLKDFEDVFIDTPDSKGILVGWDTNSSSQVLDSEEVYFAGWDNLEQHLDVIEKNILQNGWV